jgi:hypothetical protein
VLASVIRRCGVDSTGSLEEVVITAEKRVQNLQRMPFAGTAVDAQMKI